MKRIIVLLLSTIFLFAIGCGGETISERSSYKSSETSTTENTFDESDSISMSKSESYVEESSDSASSDISVPENHYRIRLYKDEVNYEVVLYERGATVVVADLPKPERVFEGKNCPFMRWLNYDLSEEVTGSFVMPAKTVILYAEFDMPKANVWSFDFERGVYTSNGEGVRAVEGIDGIYGTFSADLTIKNASTTGIGIIFNATIADVDNPFDYRSGSSYWYMHHNPTTGGFQLALVKDEYIAVQSVGLAGTPVAFQEKHNAYKLNGGDLQVEFKAVYTESAISLYVDGDLLLTYTGDKLGSLLGTQVGMRTNASGNEFSVSDYEFLRVRVENGFIIDEENGQIKALAKSTVYLFNENAGEYGVWESDVRLMRNTGTLRFGLIFNATYVNEDKSFDTWNNFNGYILYQGRGGAFRLVSNYNAWQKKPDGTTGDLANAAYTTVADGGASYKSYLDGETVEYFMHVMIERTAEYIKVYVTVGGEQALVITVTDENFLSYYGEGGVGFIAPDGDVVFSNFNFTPAE